MSIGELVRSGKTANIKSIPEWNCDFIEFPWIEVLKIESSQSEFTPLRGNGNRIAGVERR
jgi:hypothetical protein